MTREEALDLLRQVCQGNPGTIDSGYKGTFQEHSLLQQALQVVTDASEPIVAKKEAKKESDGNK